MIPTILESPNVLEPRAIVGIKTSDGTFEGICGKNFFIPSYQRGYRWDKLQVKQLITDLYEFFYSHHGAGDFYCLQPVVIKSITDLDRKASLGLPSDETWYEVIDGQQRLTTIRIILSLMQQFSPIQKFSRRKEALTFKLFYETRPYLKDAFAAIEIIESEDDNLFKAVFKSDYNGDDIDSWHILKAANHILDFFQNEETPDITIDTFTGKFKEYFTNPICLDNKESDHKSVQVLWYELNDSDANSAAALFKRLNEMCIKLNNAELIRALFLSDSAKYNTDSELLEEISDPTLKQKIISRERSRKQSHIISQWDMIEHRLHDPSIWAFISNDISSDNASSKYSCRIEYIFDLISKKTEDDRDSLSTLLEFERLARKKSIDPLWELWLKVEMYFSTILAWAKDRTMYHRIGYLVAINGRKVLSELLENATKMTKSEFCEDISSRLSVKLPNGISDIEQLWYSNNEHHKIIKQLLFLFNVESTRLSESEPFFPFDKFKKQNWTLEHIHAQNSELIDQSDRDKWKEYIVVNLEALRQLHERFKDSTLDPQKIIDRLSQDLTNIDSSKTYSFAQFRQMFDLLSEYYDSLAEKHQKADKLHSISNMALLSGKINSSIGNSVFEVKRQKIIEMDAAGEYIPLCTRKVFLKYYNSNDADFKVTQMFFWGEQDRCNYLAQLQSILTPFIKYNK